MQTPQKQSQSADYSMEEAVRNVVACNALEGLVNTPAEIEAIRQRFVAGGLTSQRSDGHPSKPAGESG